MSLDQTEPRLATVAQVPAETGVHTTGGGPTGTGNGAQLKKAVTAPPERAVGPSLSQAHRDKDAALASGLHRSALLLKTQGAE